MTTTMTAPVTTERMRILFVDDEPAILSGLRSLLHRQRKDWDMVFALGGEQAIEQLEAGPFHVVVTDMRMPKIDGAQLLAAFTTPVPARSCAMVARDVICSGSVRSSISAGLPLATARWKAGRNCAVSSTTSPWPPKLSMRRAKSGFFSAVPLTRPG